MTSAIHFWHHQARDVKYSFEDEQSWRQLSALFMQALDLTDPTLLRSILAPTFRNYLSNEQPGTPDEIITADEFVKGIFAADILGDPKLTIQHLLGAVHFVRNNHDHAVGVWQTQVTAHRTLDDGQQAAWVANTYATLYYDRIDGAWLIGGLQPSKVITQVGQDSYVIAAAMTGGGGGGGGDGNTSGKAGSIQPTLRVAGVLGRPLRTQIPATERTVTANGQISGAPTQ